VQQKISITLNSFVRRTSHTQALKNLIFGSGAQLKRKGRSRNWVMEVDSEQAIRLRNLIENSGEESWHWIEKSLTAHVPALTLPQINTIAQQHWPVTVTQLTTLTNCTIAEARAVIDGIEWGH
jgi:Ribosome recycling factor